MRGNVTPHIGDALALPVAALDGVPVCGVQVQMFKCPVPGVLVDSEKHSMNVLLLLSESVADTADPRVVGTSIASCCWVDLNLDSPCNPFGLPLLLTTGDWATSYAYGRTDRADVSFDGGCFSEARDW